MFDWLKRLIALALAGPYRQPVEKPVLEQIYWGDFEVAPPAKADVEAPPLLPECPAVPECPPVEQDQKTPKSPKPQTKRRAPRRQTRRR